MLVGEGLAVEIHDDHFKRDEEDRVWLREVGERGWVIVTKDQRLLIAGNLRGVEIAAVFREALPRIVNVLNNHSGPFVARLTKTGHISVEG